jgi:DNA-binding NtrC family response regulator
MRQNHANHGDRANDNTIALVRPAPLRILVVDDETDARELLRQVLAGEGYDITLEVSAGEALARIAKEDFDLVLSDVFMAGMNGLDLCRHIVEVRPGTPIILITGRSNVHLVIAALRAGVCDFLIKPIDAEAVVVSVAKALQHDGLRDASSRSRGETTAAPCEAKLPEKPEKYDGPANDGLDPGVTSLFEADCRRTLRTIKLLGGNKSRAAEVLGVDRRKFHRTLRQYRSDRSN